MTVSFRLISNGHWFVAISGQPGVSLQQMESKETESILKQVLENLSIIYKATLLYTIFPWVQFILEILLNNLVMCTLQ